ncbi:MAG: glycosyltransferase [Cyanobacteria bacterium J06623_4]
MKDDSEKGHPAAHHSVHPSCGNPSDSKQAEGTPSYGIVTIGRNEGTRLICCLETLKALLPVTVPIVYVDSGSTDNSVYEAKNRGADVIMLDMTTPFTGARARNAGLSRLLKTHPNLEYVQFIDGDCELLSGWLPAAIANISAHPEIAVVFGRLRERFPAASIYNQLADLEWSVSAGEAKSCGGIALMRVSALQETGGYNPALICGEEPELCIRLRRLGWKIWCLDVDMAIHDMDMHRFGQWWKRSIRYGWATAQGAAMYGSAPEKYKLKEHLSGWLWGAALPASTLMLAALTKGITLAIMLFAYSLQIGRIYRNRQQAGRPAKESFLYALFCVVSKVPQAIGQGKYWLNQWQQRPAEIIEYKQP